MIEATAVSGDHASGMTTMSGRYTYEAMGYHAFAKGIKNAADDPEFSMAVLAESLEYEMSPEDDWNQGWLIAKFKDIEKNKS